MGAALNVGGIALGILGSALYSPTFDQILPHKMSLDEVHHWANIIWAVSFLFFPLGVACFLYDQYEDLRLKHENDTEAQGEPPSIWHRDLRLVVWAEIALVIFFIGSIFFCYEHFYGALVTAVVFFTLGGVIKVALLCIELWEACCARPIGTKKEPAAAAATETTPLLKDEPKEEAAVEVEA